LWQPWPDVHAAELDYGAPWGEKTRRRPLGIDVTAVLTGVSEAWAEFWCMSLEEMTWGKSQGFADEHLAEPSPCQNLHPDPIELGNMYDGTTGNLW
jgi:hypothetical protein